MSFKVGDKVRVKGDLKVGDGRDCVTVIEEMLKYRNKIVTIKDMVEHSTFNGSTYFAYDLDGGGGWSWTEEMFESVEPQLIEPQLGDRVKIIKQKQTKNYENTCGKEGFVVYISSGSNIYGIEFPDIKNPASSYGRYYFEEGEIELVEEKKNKIPTIGDIVSEKMTCVIHTPSKEDAICVVDEIPSKIHSTTSNDWLGYWDIYEKNTCYYIVNGKIDAYGSKGFCENHNAATGNPYTIYEFSDLFATGGVVPYSNLSIFKEEKKMTITITEGTREMKIKNSKPIVIETISTTVRTELGQATTTCDKSDSYDIYTGALVAAAKITAQQSEETMLMYNLAMNMWGTDMCTAILKTLADRAMVSGSFKNVYKKWQKQIEQEEKKRHKDSITCSICGRWYNEGEDGKIYPFTPAEREEHEKWHEANRKAKRIRYQERYEAKKRIAEAEREGRIAEYIAEIVEARKKESGNND